MDRVNQNMYKSSRSNDEWGGRGDAKVLGKFSVPGRPTYLENSRAKAYCACRTYGWELFGYFSLVYLFSSLSPTL